MGPLPVDVLINRARRARALSGLPRRLDGGDVDLLHRHHRREGTLRLTATSRKRVGERTRGNVPGEAPAVFAPAALTLLAGACDPAQVFCRPVFSVNPYATPIDNVYLCSSSTPPGIGVHGMCGHRAARAALKQLGLHFPEEPRS
jgi:hypothetical protein